MREFGGTPLNDNFSMDSSASSNTPENETPASGVRIGRYEIRSQLGAGGMGEVHLAHDTQLGRVVALKILPEDLVSNPDRMRRFVQEAKSAAALSHPNVCVIHEVGSTDDGRPFISMEYVEGETLHRRMKSAPVGIAEALTIAIQIAEALVAAHSADIVHRDIKPDNIMIRLDGYVKVLDFGLAKVTPTPNRATDSEAATKAAFDTEPGAVMGTASYMSPEQARGLPVDARTDIFSLGVVLYEMLAGQLPFTGGTMSDVIASLLRSEAAPPSNHNSDVSAELDRIVLMALAKNCDERYQTAQDLLNDFRQLKKHLELGAELGVTLASGKKIAVDTKPSIGVLPFANTSSDPENEFFCEGLAEELLNALAKIEGLKVAARTSAFSFKGKNASISEIGRALNINTVLEGSVGRSGNRVRVAVRLVNVADGYHLWSERYDRELKDIFDVQDEIALAVVDALKLKLLGEEKDAVLKRYTENTEVYELYLRGRHYLNKYTGEGWRKAAEYFQKAIEKEPDYAPAYSGIALCCGALWFFGSLHPDKIVPKWRAAVTRALVLDSSLAEAHFTLASIHFYIEWNWDETERDYQRAFELSPNNADAHWRYGLFLASQEKYDDAVRAARRALELDPLSLIVGFFAVWILWFSRRFDEAFAQAQKMIEIEPNFYGAHWQMGAVYGAKGMYDEAIEAFKKSLALGGESRYPVVLGSLGNAYAMAGRRAEAQEVLEQMFDIGKTQYVAPFHIARVYSGMDDHDQTFHWLEKAYEERNGGLVFLSADTRAGGRNLFSGSFLTDPRLPEMLRRVGLPSQISLKKNV